MNTPFERPVIQWICNNTIMLLFLEYFVNERSGGIFFLISLYIERS